LLEEEKKYNLPEKELAAIRTPTLDKIFEQVTPKSVPKRQDSRVSNHFEDIK
jgi:hypothetical protein